MYHFVSIFGSTEDKIKQGWQDRGEYKGYSEHVLSVAKQFKHCEVHPAIWTKNIPASSASCHLFLKAIHLLEKKQIISNERCVQHGNCSLYEAAIRQIRTAFFKDLVNVATYESQIEIAKSLGLPVDDITKLIKNGEAYAELCLDLKLKDQYSITGSPTYILNEGRQKLYGNVGYRVIEANIKEILQSPGDQASWC